MPPKNIPEAGPLSGSEKAIVIQDGKPVRTTTQAIADKAAVTKGETGAQGPKGDAGPQGLKGNTGIQGPTGATGGKGDTGATGAVGSPRRIERFAGSTNASGIATVTFSPAFESTPDIDVIEGWVNDQMITGAVVSGSASKTGCQVQVMLSRGTLLLTSGPFQKAVSGVSVTVRAIGN